MHDIEIHGSFCLQLLLSSVKSAISKILIRELKETPTANIRPMVPIILVYLTSAYASSETANLALNKRATFCDIVDSFLSVLTDGDRSIESSIRTDAMCGRRGFVAVDFGEELYVHHVDVYHGERYASRSPMDYFQVETRQVHSERVCNYYTAPALGPNRTMRVNCDVLEPLLGIKLSSLVDQGVSVAEIEAYTLALRPPDYLWIPRGCYERVSIWSSVETEDWRTCSMECRRSSVPFAAFENGSTCHCVTGYSDKDQRPLGECHRRCRDSDHYCGGYERYSLYVVDLQLPKSYGCVRSPSGGLKLVKDVKMTPSYCIRLCERYKRALLEGGDTCVCSDDWETLTLDHHGDMTACGTRCSGESELFCGGSHASSIYRTCYLDEEEDHTLCSLMFRCSGEMDEYGKCRGGCQENYIGEHCVERTMTDFKPVNVCSVLSPCRQLAHSRCTPEGDGFRCECMPGSKMFATGCRTDEEDEKKKKREKRDACAGNPCGELPNAECVVENDLYTCRCKAGFENSTGRCEGIVSCPADLCDNKTSFCVVANGVFSCECFKGYIAVSKNSCLSLTLIIIPFSFVLVIPAVIARFAFTQSRLVKVKPVTSLEADKTEANLSN